MFLLLTLNKTNIKGETMLFYIPLEHIPQRYTVHMDRDIEKYLNEKGIKYWKVFPELKAGPLPEGMFLNAPFTCKFKSAQLKEIAHLFETDVIKDGDTIWFSDIWFPGIEQIAYMKYFCKKPNVKIKGIIHAGSFTDTDFVRDMERWAKNFEDIVFDIADEVFCASNFIKKDILKKRLVSKEKLTVSGLPLDFGGLNRYQGKTKKNKVIFNGRNCDEKQPWLFDRLEKQVKNVLPNVEFINTQKEGFTKDEYYTQLAEAKVVVSYALQENFGFGIAEAAWLGCKPVLPDSLVYPEFYPSSCLYKTFDESVIKVISALESYKPLEKFTLERVFSHNCFNTWFKDC